MSDSDLIPLMYRAQIDDRGKIQYAGKPKLANQWVDEWLNGCPVNPDDREKGDFDYKMPRFATGDRTWQQVYTISWRLVTNCGQDEDVIRPVIGAKGMPYYPGSSMKGAFLRACLQIAPDKVIEYCGGEVEETIAGKKQKKTKPGILRFHGGYPIDMSWGEDSDRLVDVVHSQQERQVMEDGTSRANVQISLYKTKFKFGISSIGDRFSGTEFYRVDWNQVEKIWEHALSEGLGSRTSAGYGRFEKVENGSKVFLASNKTIVSVNLRGLGITSTLLNKTPEFRPNMMKAALRGHTLRLLGGVTNPETAKKMTKDLWGGFADGGDEKGSIVGKFSVDLQVEKLAYGTHEYGRNISMSLYNLKSGYLNIATSKDYTQADTDFLTLLIKFSLLLGGFGKSWRRIHHDLFYSSYFANNEKPMIGCHWSFGKPAEAADYCITAPRGELNNIQVFLASIPNAVRNYFQLQPSNSYANNWRDVWHPQKVQVWGRIANDKNDSQAIEWFHRNNFIKRTELTGQIQPSRISRIWHRMYPLYVKRNGVILHKKNDNDNLQYVELLTFFPPNNSERSQKFLEVLEKSDFTKLWGGN